MKKPAGCPTCGRPMAEHTIETIRGRLEWVCPTVVVRPAVGVRS